MKRRRMELLQALCDNLLRLKTLIIPKSKSLELRAVKSICTMGGKHRGGLKKVYEATAALFVSIPIGLPQLLRLVSMAAGHAWREWPLPPPPPPPSSTDHWHLRSGLKGRGARGTPRWPLLRACAESPRAANSWEGVGSRPHQSLRRLISERRRGRAPAKPRAGPRASAKAGLQATRPPSHRKELKKKNF